MDEWIVRTLLTLAGLAGGFALGLVTAWANGAVGEMGRQWAVDHRERRQRHRDNQAAARKQSEHNVRLGVAKFNANQKRKQLEDERVGRQFRRRYTPDDVGVIATVTELAETDDRVIMSFTVPPERPPTAYDPLDFNPTSVEWAGVTMPPEKQRALMELHRRNQPDPRGWVQWEEITKKQ